MEMRSRFDIGDTVWFVKVTMDGAANVLGPLTVGQIEIKVRDSKGREGEEMFDNYMPQKSRDEYYMCDETGVGSGQNYSVDSLFATEEEANAFARGVNEANELFGRPSAAK